MKKIRQYSKVRVIRIPPDLVYTFGKDAAKIGDVGVVVEIYRQKGLPDGYDVEFDKAGVNWLATFHLEDIEAI